MFTNGDVEAIYFLPGSQVDKLAEMSELLITLSKKQAFYEKGPREAVSTISAKNRFCGIY